ncbi:hypothetical protein V2J09_016575 [Rumex salicifolius]
MESRAQRRMAALSRQLQPQSAPNSLLRPALLSGRQRMREDPMPVVIGGMVLDVLSTPSVSANPRSTTPGKVDFMLGGVARNIGECIAKLGTKCYMISAVGCDMAGVKMSRYASLEGKGQLLLAHWKSAGLPIAGIRHEKEIRTATVNCMFDVDGELVAGVANVESIERFLTHEWIQQSRSALYSAPLLVLDANVTPATLESSCQMAAEFDIPIWFEPVSVAKSKRVTSIAKYITFASPNELELIEMANALSHGPSFAPIDNDYSTNSPESLFQMLKSAILVLLENGIKFVLVTLGPSGVFLCSRGVMTHMGTLFNSSRDDTGNNNLYNVISRNCPPERSSKSPPFKGISNLSVVHFPAVAASVTRVSGAGDCLVGGVIASLCSGLNIMQGVAVGVAAAKAAIQVETNVPFEYNMATIADDARLIYSAAKVLS